MRFNGLDKELLNIKDVIKMLEQYSRRNNLEITKVPENVEDEKLEEKVIEILQKIAVNCTIQAIEACHRIRKLINNSKKKTIMCFFNRKYAKKALLKRKGLSNIDRSLIGLSCSSNLFLNENLTPTNSKLASRYSKLKRDGHIKKRTQEIHIVYSTW